MDILSSTQSSNSTVGISNEDVFASNWSMSMAESSGMFSSLLKYESSLSHSLYLKTAQNHSKNFFVSHFLMVFEDFCVSKFKIDKLPAEFDAACDCCFFFCSLCRYGVETHCDWCQSRSIEKYTAFVFWHNIIATVFVMVWANDWHCIGRKPTSRYLKETFKPLI